MTAVTPAGLEPTAEASAPCAFCATAMQADQEWCLECGSARTILRRAANPGVPVALVGLVVAGAVAAFLVAVASLGGSTRTLTPHRLTTGAIPAAAAAVTSTAPSSSTPAPTRAAAGSGPRAASIASWPPGLSGWTVALATTPEESVARKDARVLAAGGLSVGVLDTSQHPHMHAGDYIVFSRRYPTDAGAAAAAVKLAASGHAGAYPIEVAPPGGV